MTADTFKNVRSEALRIMERIEKEGAYSHLLINYVLNEGRIAPKDQSLLTELVYGTIKRKNTLDFYLQPFVKKGLHSLDHWVLQLLRLSMYQLKYLDRVPERAVIHEAVNIAKARGHQGISGFVNGVLRSVQRCGTEEPEESLSGMKKHAVLLSHPEWLLQEWVEDYGEKKALDMAAANLLPPQMSVRINPLKTTVDLALNKLESEGCIAEQGSLSMDALRITEGKAAGSPSYKEGLFTIQDESSMLVGRVLDPRSGMSTVDTCAAPGGKTTHLAERMQDRGKIHAFDLHEKKIGLIKEQADRLGLTTITAQAVDARKLTETLLPESADRILVDAPCSGYGVIRRKPELKWQKKREDAERLPAIQSAILQEASRLLKPGGRLVYSTCTVRKAENEQVISAFLHNNPDFTLEANLADRLPPALKDYLRPDGGYVTILPQYFHTDGFFIASLQKN
ncbi:16S rRNA (cytosine(967)-C(5))-methyltransferase RsmB [Alteribacillus sp. HJP-4]|uniref:16S rRNA (cytosine(967)-C(5))-methyltransferase RsmB n=1 Tax=Alteribacillus sp. HJP-4 TaxID=2775394 RepID=UPI0035CCEDE3